MTFEEMKTLRRENQKNKRCAQTAEQSKRYFEIISKFKTYLNDVIINVIKSDGFKSFTDGEPSYIQSFGIKLDEWIGGNPNQEEVMSELHKLVGDTVRDMTKEKVSELIEDLGTIRYVETSTNWTYLTVELEIHWI